MNSWEIIKAELTKKSRPKSTGRLIDLNLCCDVFMALSANLKDEEVAMAAFNADEEVRDALLARGGIEEMRKAGIIQ